MKKTFLILLSIFIVSCKSSSIVTENPTKEISTNNTEAQTVEAKPKILIGKQDRKAFDQEPYNSWFNPNYDNYTIDTETTKKLSPYLKDVTIQAFMGTWCGDSKRETPIFYKILDNTVFDYKNLELIAVSRAKETPKGYEKNLNIVRVPTFIFYKNGKEIGRYVEFARESLEKDILAIVSGKSYKHSYQD